MLLQYTLLAMLPVFVQADFYVWQGACDTGLGDGGGFGSYSLATADQGSCGGCDAGRDTTGIYGGNPCNGDCGADPLALTPNGDNLDIIVQNTGINVGYCEPDSSQDGYCEGWNYACSEFTIYFCHTYYCN